jgi:hypothetical protein
MGYALLSDIRDAISSAAGSCDKDALTKLVNDERQWLYHQYDRLPLFREAVQCFEVQTFCETCRPCGQTYRGITLPRDMQTPEGIWFNRRPLTLHSSWREWQVGIEPWYDCGLSVDDMGSIWPTERDLPPNIARKLKVYAVRKEDIGKRFAIYGINEMGDSFEQEFELTNEYQATEMRVSELRKPMGIVKDVTVGMVVLADETGRVLSRYAPDETIPAYKRLRINGISGHCIQVNVRASRRYFPLTDDNDIVESDNHLGFEQLTHYFRLNRKLNKGSNDLKSMALHLETALSLFAGEKAREIGKASHDQVAFAGARHFMGTSLRSRRTRFRY